jgi:hypothetical protein
VGGAPKWCQPTRGTRGSWGVPLQVVGVGGGVLTWLVAIYTMLPGWPASTCLHPKLHIWKIEVTAPPSSHSHGLHGAPKLPGGHWADVGGVCMTVGGMLLASHWELGTGVYHAACRVPTHCHKPIHTHMVFHTWWCGWHWWQGCGRGGACLQYGQVCLGACSVHFEVRVCLEFLEFSLEFCLGV